MAYLVLLLLLRDLVLVSVGVSPGFGLIYVFMLFTLSTNPENTYLPVLLVFVSE